MVSTHLQQICQLYRISTCYRDMHGLDREVREETLLAILKALGASFVNIGEIPSSLRLKQLHDWQNVCSPVIVVWAVSTPTIELKLPAYLLGSLLPVTLTFESGDRQEELWKVAPSSVISQKRVEGSVYLVVRFSLPSFIPLGYHKLRIDLPGVSYESLIISAPVKAYSPLNANQKRWGVFLPLYALHSKESWGSGNYTDLKKLMQWVAGIGGDVVGTLPLLACFYDQKFGNGPYLPASKTFWNEFYLDITKVPEFSQCGELKDYLSSEQARSLLSEFNNSPNVQYKSELQLKKGILAKMASYFWKEKPARFVDFEIYLANNPQVFDYARFRAMGEYFGLDWHDWPLKFPESASRFQDTTNYHAYVQWLASQQIAGLNFQTGDLKNMLYMDMPVGIHPLSYDIWKEPYLFASEVSCGAPPDPAFTNGQNWDFPPLHPEQIRQNGYVYFIRGLRHHLKSCAMLRLDHMMGFHRIFWIPNGMSTREGTYVKYPAEEFYAILTLESHRHKSVIVGEDLGLVPEEVRPEMEKHSIRRMFIGQFELISDNKMGVVPNRAVAALNTHDMFPFAAFWEEYDIIQRQKLNIIDAATARSEVNQRRRNKLELLSVLQYKKFLDPPAMDSAAILNAVLKLLALSTAETLIVNLEDLWLERNPQNIPGTIRPQNWSRRAKLGLEQFTELPAVIQILKEINDARRN